MPVHFSISSNNRNDISDIIPNKLQRIQPQ